MTYEELETGRPAHLATDLRLKLVEAQRTLATGAAEDAVAAYTRLLAEAEQLGLDGERATALLGLGQCALETGELPVARERFEAAEKLLANAPLPQRAPAVRGGPSRTSWRANSGTPAICWRARSTN